MMQGREEGTQEMSTPTIEAAHAMGTKGGPVVEAERLAFEAWMAGHYWPLGAMWDGKQYIGEAEKFGDLSPRAMITRQLWAAWRDRAALFPQPAQSTQAEVTDAAIDAATRHIYHNGRPTSKEYRVGIARAILALRTATQPCGHPASLVIRSAESGEALYCDACDDKSGRRDAEMREGELLEANQKLRDEILALRPAVPMTEEEAKELIKKSDLLEMFLHIGWYSAPRKNFDTHALALIRAVESRYAGITAQAKKETP